MAKQVRAGAILAVVFALLLIGLMLFGSPGTVSANSTSQNDMGSATDAGNSTSAALTIPSNTSGSGFIDASDTDDYYKISLSAAGELNISLSPPTGADFDLKLYDSSGSQVDYSDLGGSQIDSITCNTTNNNIDNCLSMLHWRKRVTYWWPDFFQFDGVHVTSLP